MKRKTYEKKLRNFRYQLNQLPTSKKVREFRISRPDFGFVPEWGKYAGVPVVSYQQMWDMLVEGMKGTPLEDKI